MLWGNPMILSRLYDNHIIARTRRFLMTFWRRSCTYVDCTAYDKDGRCMFIGYDYIGEKGEERTKIIWVHPDKREEFAQTLTEED